MPRLEGKAKVTGRAEYVHNLRLPGMLHGKIFRSTIAHGRIKRIDTSAARAVEGVHRVITGADIRTIIPDPDRKSTRLNSSHIQKSRMPSSA